MGTWSTLVYLARGGNHWSTFVYLARGGNHWDMGLVISGIVN